MAGKSKPGAIHLRIVEVMKRFPDGISGGQIREELEREGLEPRDQTHLDRRKRDLPKWFLITKDIATFVVNGKKRRVTLYKFGGNRVEIVDEGQINRKVWAQVIHSGRGRCQMCGRSVEKHGIALVVDHKKPREWGGTNELDNLWAICEDCNSGKKAYFSSLNVDSDLMKSVMAHTSVHMRIGELLKAVGIGARVSSQLMDIVADQDDWQKRLRELRYPVIGWEIDTKLYFTGSGKKQCDYILRSFNPWPRDPSSVIRQFEADRKRRNLERPKN
ncbi:MAG: HNH endonuclease signature motif containing protein [Candidatus Sulfotelmatobacter sp.]